MSDIIDGNWLITITTPELSSDAMKRRAYLAVAALGLSGCAGLTGDEDETGDENGDGNGTGNGDGNGNGSGNGDGSDPNGEESGSFDDFENLDAWEVMEGDLSADTDRSVVGSQSALLESTDDEPRVMIKREFDSPRDLSDQLPALAATADTDVNPLIQLTDVTGDRLLLRSAVQADDPFVARNFGVVSLEGVPDLSETLHVKISAWAGDDRAVKLWVDDLQLVSRPETGTVLLQFDDGYDSVAADALPILEEHDYPATAFVDTEYVGSADYMTVDQLEELEAAGWTIGSQGTRGTNLTDLDESEQEAEIADALEWLDEHGFGDDVPFAYPLNEYDESALELAAEYHDLAFAGGYPVHGNAFNPHLLPRMVNPDGDEAGRILDRTAAYRGITTITYRDLDADSRSDLEDTVEHIASLEAEGDLEVVLPGDLEIA